jgi:hypothetical protein
MHSLLGATWLESLVVQWLHRGAIWQKIGCGLSHLLFFHHWWQHSISAIHLLRIIESSEFQPPSLLRKWLLLHLGVVNLQFFPYGLFLVAIDIVFHVLGSASKKGKFSDLAPLHGDCGEISWANFHITLVIKVVFFLLVLLQRNILELSLVQLLSGVFGWLEIEVMTTFFEAIFDQGTQSSGGLRLVHVADADVALTREVDAVVFSLFLALRVEVLWPNDYTTILVLVSRFRWKFVRFSDSDGYWLRKKAKTWSVQYEIKI